MPRRPPPKVDPKRDLRGRLVPLADLPRPWAPEALFGRRAPLEIEIGSGKGLFLCRAASEQPDRDFVGCELAQAYARAAAARLAAADLTNALVIGGDAQRLLAQCVPADTIEAVHVYFPDPWWKRRHRKRRVMSAEFAAEAARVLRAGGRLHFWTDVEEYFRSTLKLLTTVPELRGPRPVEEPPAEHDFDYRTHFERRVRRRGETVYRAEYIKSSAEAPPRGESAGQCDSA